MTMPIRSGHDWNEYTPYDPEHDLTCSTEIEPAPSSGVDSGGQIQEANVVALCHREAHLPGAAILGIEHYWLKTSSKEAGMAPSNGGVPGHGSPDLPFTPTTVNDHTGESDLPDVECLSFSGVDENCVNAHLTLGEFEGLWTPLNNCQTFAVETILDCKREPYIETATSQGASAAD